MRHPARERDASAARCAQPLADGNDTVNISRMGEHSGSRPRNGSRRSIQSVETGLRLLSILAGAGGPATLTLLSARSGLSASQTHRYLQSLIAAGMATQDRSARYDLGPAVIRVGIAALARTSAFARAESALERFVEETGRTSALSVWGEAGPVCVRWFHGATPVITAVAVGSILPVLSSASGQVYLALLSEGELRPALDRARAHGLAIPDLDALRTQIRGTLLGSANGDSIPGLRTMAAPVFDLQGNLAAVAATLASAQHPREHDAAVGQRLLRACREATLEAGGTWPLD
jgi:DNA-binding IclR family transcriptional regulator